MNTPTKPALSADSLSWPDFCAMAALGVELVSMFMPYDLLGYPLAIAVALAFAAILGGERRLSLLALGLACLSGWAIYKNTQEIALVSQQLEAKQSQIRQLKATRDQLNATITPKPVAAPPPKQPEPDPAAERAHISTERERLMRLKAEKEAELARMEAKAAYYQEQAKAWSKQAEQDEANTAAQIEAIKRRNPNYR